MIQYGYAICNTIIKYETMSVEYNQPNKMVNLIAQQNIQVFTRDFVTISGNTEILPNKFPCCHLKLARNMAGAETTL